MLLVGAIGAIQGSDVIDGTSKSNGFRLTVHAGKREKHIRSVPSEWSCSRVLYFKPFKYITTEFLEDLTDYWRNN